MGRLWSKLWNMIFGIENDLRILIEVFPWIASVTLYHLPKTLLFMFLPLKKMATIERAIFLQTAMQWSNAMPGSFSLFAHHPLHPGSITKQSSLQSKLTLCSSVVGRGLGRGGYQSITADHSLWPQPCNGTAIIYTSVHLHFSAFMLCAATTEQRHFMVP